MSPHKPSRPRVSDDTALLQAFLNRAAEGKNSRRISATKRESITNRRDSDAVRQALASPAKAEVLADLDPNSPSPRKPNGAGVFDGVDERHAGIFLCLLLRGGGRQDGRGEQSKQGCGRFHEVALGGGGKPVVCRLVWHPAKTIHDVSSLLTRGNWRASE